MGYYHLIKSFRSQPRLAHPRIVTKKGERIAGGGCKTRYKSESCNPSLKINDILLFHTTCLFFYNVPTQIYTSIPLIFYTFILTLHCLLLSASFPRVHYFALWVRKPWPGAGLSDDSFLPPGHVSHGRLSCRHHSVPEKIILWENQFNDIFPVIYPVNFVTSNVSLSCDKKRVKCKLVKINILTFRSLSFSWLMSCACFSEDKAIWWFSSDLSSWASLEVLAKISCVFLSWFSNCFAFSSASLSLALTSACLKLNFNIKVFNNIICHSSTLWKKMTIIQMEKINKPK